MIPSVSKDEARKLLLPEYTFQKEINKQLVPVTSLKSSDALLDLLRSDVKYYPQIQKLLDLLVTSRKYLFDTPLDLSNEAFLEQRRHFVNRMEQAGLNTNEEKADFVQYACVYHGHTQVDIKKIFDLTGEDKSKPRQVNAVAGLPSSTKITLLLTKVAKELSTDEAIANICTMFNNTMQALITNDDDINEKQAIFNDSIRRFTTGYAGYNTQEILIRSNGKPFIEATHKGLISYNGRQTVDVKILIPFLLAHITERMRKGFANIFTELHIYPYSIATLFPVENDRQQIRVEVALATIISVLLDFVAEKTPILAVHDTNDYLARRFVDHATRPNRLYQGPNSDRAMFIFEEFAVCHNFIENPLARGMGVTDCWFVTVNSRPSYTAHIQSINNKLREDNLLLFSYYNILRNVAHGYVAYDFVRKKIGILTHDMNKGHHYSKKNGVLSFFSETGYASHDSPDKIYMGMEVELASKQNFTNQYTALVNSFMFTNLYFTYIVSAEHDGSIAPAGREWIFNPMTPGVAREVMDVFLNHPLIKNVFTANDTCGVHIHVGKSYFKDAVMFAKWYAFFGGDEKANRPFIEYIAQRPQNRFCYQANKSIGSGLYHFTRSDKLAQHNNDYLNSRYCAVNVVTGIPTYEVRIFKGTIDPTTMFKNIEFVWASLRFATWVNRAYLGGHDFIQWLQRYPRDFHNLINWLFTETGSTKKDWTEVKNKLYERKILSSASSGAKACDVKEESVYLNDILNPKPKTSYHQPTLDMPF